MKVADIIEELANHGIVNRKTGEPLSRNTVDKDILSLRKQWRKRAENAVDEMLTNQLSDLQQFKHMCLREEKYTEYLGALKHEARLLGLDSKERDISDSTMTVVKQAKGELLKKLGELEVKQVYDMEPESSTDEIIVN
jgi:hypothetical protein